MVRICGTLFKSAEPFRRYLRIDAYEWGMKSEINDIVRSAWPMLDTVQLINQLRLIESGQEPKFMPETPNAIHSVLQKCYGCRMPFLPKTHHVEIKKEDINKLIKPKDRTKYIRPVISEKKGRKTQMEELEVLKNSLLAELAKVQNSANYTDDNGEIDATKVEMIFKRADTVNSVAGKITEIHRLQLESKRIKIDAVKIALEHGFAVDMSSTLGLEVKE